MLTEAREVPRALGTGWVLLILGLAAAVRFIGVAALAGDELAGDPLFYSAQAKVVADGEGFTDPFAGFSSSTSVESADHPPLFVTYLAAWTVVGADTQTWHRIASATVGLGTVALVTVLGFRLGGRRAAIVAGLLAAVWPNLWFWDIEVQAESITALAVAGFSVAGLAFLRRPSAARLAAVGALAGLAALGRAEFLLLAVAVPLLGWAVARMGAGERVRWIGIGLAGTLLVLAPWTAYNTARFDRPVLLSNGLGLVLVSSNCDTTYYGSSIGYWWFGCSVSGTTAAGIVPGDDQSEADPRKRDVAVAYALDHPTRLPAVATARALRFVGLWDPGNSSELAASNEGLPRPVFLPAQVLWLLAVGFGALAAWRFRQAGRRLAPLVAPPIVGLVTAAIVYGIIRFRAPIEPPVIALAAVGLLAVWDPLAARWGRAGPAAVPVPSGRRIVRRDPEVEPQADPAEDRPARRAITRRVDP